MTVLLSFLAGAAVSGLYVLYIKAVTANRPLHAASFELTMSLIGSISFQVWALRESDFRVLAAWDVGGALGTYFLLRRGFKRETGRPGRDLGVGGREGSEAPTARSDG